MIRWLAAACVFFAVSYPAASAWSAALSIDFRFQGCPDLVQSDAHKLVSIELAAAQIAGSPTSSTTQIAASCDETHVDVVVRDANVGELSRSLRWQGVEVSARTRLFALAVAEMITAAYREQRQNAIPHPSVNVPTSRSVALPEISAATAPALKDPRLRMQVSMGLSRLGSAWSLAPTLAAGVSWSWSQNSRVLLRWDINALYAASPLQGGNVALTALGTTPGVRLQMRGAKYVGYVETGAMLGLASVIGTATDDRIEGRRRTAFWWGPVAAVGVARGWRKWQFGLAVATMLVAKPVQARSLAGTTLLQSAGLSTMVPSFFLSVGRQL